MPLGDCLAVPQPGRGDVARIIGPLTYSVMVRPENVWFSAQIQKALDG